MLRIRAVLVSWLATAAVASVAAAPATARARGWQGVVPGVTSEQDVAARFGQPSTQGKVGGKVALVYKGDQAIPGTRQAQFFVRDDGVVGEIVVFPAAQLDREAVEGTYGRPATKAFTDDFRAVWLYKASGVTVYFAKDGFVDAISFKPPAAEPAPGGRERPAPGARRDAAPARSEPPEP